jgi:hypothetical protein
MPSAAGLRKQASSALGSIIKGAIGGEGAQVLNFVDFLESPLGPKIKLYPVQYALGKILFGVPLDYKEVMVPVWDKFRENLICKLTEREFLKHMADHGKCNVADWRDLKPEGYTEMEIICGRRGGKSQWVSACADYTLYKLLAIRNPQEYYGLVDGSTIDFTILAQDEDGAGRLFSKIRNDINRSEFFRPYLYGTPGVDEIKLLTEADRGRRDALPSITIASLPCTTRASRGPSSIFLCFDEFAFFRNALGSRSDEVYDSAKPATMQFVGPEGQRDAKVLTITSPWTRVGMVWDMKQLAMKEGKDSSVFMMQLATAEMNPRADARYLRDEFKRKEAVWPAEYGGEFIDSSGSLVSPAKIDLCVDMSRGNDLTFNPRRAGITYFWGIDLGLKIDATGLAVCHWEMGNLGPTLVYDYIDRMIVGDELHQNVDQLSITEILVWFELVNQMYPGAFGCCDQYQGAAFITLCQLRGINFIELVHLTGGINSQMYFALQGYLNQGICRFPNVPLFLHEIKNVEAFYVGKTALKVEAPNEKGAHDDMCDAVALAAWRAQKWMLETGGKDWAFTGGAMLQGPDAMRPGEAGLNPDYATLSQLRMAERARGMDRFTARGGIWGAGGRASARGNRF